MEFYRKYLKIHCVYLLRLILFLFFLVSLNDCGLSQQIYLVNYDLDDKVKGLPNSIKLDTAKNKVNVQQQINNFRFQLIERGYFLNEISRIDSSRLLFVRLGERFSKIKLIDSVDCNRGVFNSKKITHYLSPKQFSSYMRNKSVKYLNSGYPFANVFIDQTSIEGMEINSYLRVDKGKYSRLMKIHIKGDSSISLNTIQSIIGVSIGDFYSEEVIAFIDNKIAQNNFIRAIKPSEILFTTEGYELFLYLKSDRVSFLRGAVGLQPDPVSQKMALTGEVNLKLENTLKKGELLKLNWRSIKPQTQRLNIDFKYPFLFQSPFGIAANFLLYKRDSTFLDLNAEFNVSYKLNNGTTFRAHYRYVNSNLLGGAENSIEFQSLSSYSTNSYGLSFDKKQVDNIVNPSKGNAFMSKFYLGQRTLNSDSYSVSNVTVSGHIHYQQYIPFFKRHVLFISGSFDMYSSPVIYQNELFRFGGLNTLRGFNEEELFASVKGIATIEYRFLLDQSSNIFIFYDQCIYENNALEYFKDQPFGFGAGISFGSKIGIFNITYALGKKFSNPIDFRSSKIHFGYTAYF